MVPNVTVTGATLFLGGQWESWHRVRFSLNISKCQKLITANPTFLAASSHQEFNVLCLIKHNPQSYSCFPLSVGRWTSSSRVSKPLRIVRGAATCSCLNGLLTFEIFIPPIEKQTMPGCNILHFYNNSPSSQHFKNFSSHTRLILYEAGKHCDMKNHWNIY